MSRTIIFILSAVWFVLPSVTAAQISTWNPIAQPDDFEIAVNWLPPGVPGMNNAVRIVQIGGRISTPVRIHENHVSHSLHVHDARAILDLNGHEYRLTSTTGSASAFGASILVGGIKSFWGGSLEVTNGTLVGNDMYVGPGLPGTSAGDNQHTPFVGILKTATLNLSGSLKVGYREQVPLQFHERAFVSIGGNANCENVGVASQGTLYVANGGRLTVSDKLSSTGELKVGLAGAGGGIAGPRATVIAQTVGLGPGTTTIENGILTAGVALTVWGNGTVSVTGGSVVQSPVAFISGLASNWVPQVTLSGNESTWSNAKALYVGGNTAGATNPGIVTIGTGASVVAGNRIKIWGPGKIELQGGTIVSPMIEVEGGELCGTGTIYGSVVNNGGTVAPGCSLGTLHVRGDYRQDANSKFLVEIRGPNAGEFDVLRVDGAASLGGTLEVTFVDGFVPGPDYSFQIISSASTTGSFDRVDVTSGAKIDVTLGATGLDLTFPSEPEQDVAPTGTNPWMWIAGIALALVLAFIIYVKVRKN